MIEFRESLKMATSMLLANKLRSSLTMLGIVIGNASVVAMLGIGQGAQRLATSQLEDLGPNVLFVLPGSQRNRRASFNLPKTLVLSDAEAIAAQVPSVAGVAPEINRRLLVSHRNVNTNATVVGTTPEYPAIRNFSVAQGRFLNILDLERHRRVAVIGSEIADRLYQTQTPLGQNIRISNITFEVIGVMETKGSSLGSNQDEFIFIPLDTMVAQLVGRTSPYGIELSWINVKAKDSNSVRAATFQMENLLRLRHNIQNGEDDFGVSSAKQMLDIVNTITGGLTILLAAIAGISLIVGGIGVMNIMLVSVTERTQEIGLRKALGAGEQDILSQFLIEAVIVSASGGVIGVVLGMAIVAIVGSLSPLITVISPTAVVVSLTISGSIGLFFGVVPARQAAKLDPIVALRNA
ncbi:MULTISPECIES: ABC transporter permease [unclassified Synechocystis]|uniref:ABC transporter permease n=1 Tax=unclassified Synechocystis TaxID=2640012 RepID=UPI00040123FD|nr:MULTISPECIES: ABC transporter permease [unclassified Synechocystis]AIE75485.1 Cell division protein FtsX [Synechocystis sp. PCC 6714]MCT0253700.1 ABC transporter permease [Synechocystis sp. CS-94]